MIERILYAIRIASWSDQYIGMLLMKDSRSGAFVYIWSIGVLSSVLGNLFASWKELFCISFYKIMWLLCFFNMSIVKSPKIKAGIVVEICCNNFVSLEKNN